jgi:hypothetical protein
MDEKAMKRIIFKTFILLAIAIYSATSTPAYLNTDTIHTSAGDQRRRDDQRAPEGRDRERPNDGNRDNRRSDDNNNRGNDQSRPRDRDNGGQNNDRGKDIRIIPRPDKGKR